MMITTANEIYIPNLRNPDNVTVDCIIMTIPLTITAIPLMAPASLKPVIESTGLTCKAVDFNNDVFNIIKDHPLRPEIISFLDSYKFEHYEIIEFISNIFETAINAILSFKPKIVCISLLTTSSHISAKWLMYLLKKADPSITVVAGGSGCLDTFVGMSEFITFMLENKYIDYHIRGDGEHALYELLTGNDKFGGINSINWKQLTREQLANLPIPDYSDYNFSGYDSFSLPILGSRGCVRKCQYCDYIENWKKFTWRTADDVFHEMLTQHKKYGIQAFKFQDSLINGNVTEFNRLMELIGDWNELNPTKTFSWGGFYIFRNVNKNTDHEWDLIKRSNAAVLTVGVENFNEDIRFMIGKKFSNEAIDYHLEKALELNIKVSLLFIIGYVTEDQYHIDFIKDWLRSHTKFISILHFKWGTLSVLPDTYLYNHKEELGIQLNSNSNTADWTDLNTGHTDLQRKLWYKEIIELCQDLGYTVRTDRDDHYLLEQLLIEVNKRGM